jgi:TonB-dependent starch-binding outer membrane protein SusC
MKSTKTIRLRTMMLWGILLVFLANTNAFAQSAKVSGTVTDEQNGTPVPGVTVTVKKTSRSAITDAAGRFTIDASPGDVLVFSAVGFTGQEIKAGAGEVKIQLKEAVNQLENVIVIGYGTQKKKLVTGATSQVKGEDLAKLGNTNALQALQGQAAGVNITSTSGQPGGGFKVMIRGAGTIGNASPLYVVDGVITSDITYLNNSDIASVDILKDAASCAIYGINGANGVVLITTRTGKSGKKDGQISIDAYYGVQNVARKLPMLNAEQYATMQNEAAVNSGKAPLFTQAQIDALAQGSSLLPAHGTDWLKQIFSTNVPIQNINISANGGSDVSTYSIGGSYTEQGGIIGGANQSDYKRTNFKANSERKLYDGALKVGEHLTFSMIDQKGVADGGLYSGNVLAGAIATSPLLAMYNEKGNYLDSRKSTIYNGGVWNNTEANPYALMKYNNQNDTKTQRVVGNVYAELEPIKNLRIRSSFGLNYSSSSNHSYRPAYDTLSIYAFNSYENITQGASQGYTWNFDNTINYQFNIKEHKFDVLAGSAVRQSRATWNNISNTGTTLFGSFDRAYLSNSMVTGITMSPNDTSRQHVDNTIALNGNTDAIYAQSSFFGRVNYSWKEKYLASAIFRADGSTLFAPGHQWGYFPSLSAGWVASNEDFMAATKTWLNFLKLRASWGTNGNDRIDAFNYLSLISLANARYNYGSDNATLTQGSYPQTIGVESTKWETSRQTNIGIDARFLNNKLDMSLDFYNKTTKDWLVAAPLLATAGVSINPYINGGNVTNKGVELQLAYNGNVGHDLTYTVSGSYAYNKNMVNNIPTADGIIHGGTNSLFVNGPEFFRAAAGNPIGYFWGYKTAGIFQNTAEVQAWSGKSGLLQPNAQPGDVKLVDLNGDGVIDAKDKTNIGDPNPHHIFGFRFAANYKNFDLGITTNGVAGNKIVQAYRSPGQWANSTTEILGRWHGEGTSNTKPRITQNSSNWVEFSDLYIHDGSYLRVSNVTLGYDVAKLVRWKYVSQFRLYVAAQNLITFTKYTGMDPEVGASAPDASGNSATTNNPHSFGQGVDNGFYPRPRVYMAGVNITF